MQLSLQQGSSWRVISAPGYFLGGTHEGQMCWELTVCSKLAFSSLHGCVSESRSYLFLTVLSLTEQEITHKASSLAPHRPPLLWQRSVSTYGKPSWGGWLTQLCCPPRGVLCASEAPKKQDATLSSSFHHLKLKVQRTTQSQDHYTKNGLLN